MSREYGLQVKASAHLVSEPEFSRTLTQQGVRVDDVHGFDDVLCASGQITLAGGEDPEEAHRRLAGALGTRLRTSWLFLEDREWDHIIDDLGPGDPDEEIDEDPGTEVPRRLRRSAGDVPSRDIRCFVVCRNASGEPDVAAVTVTATPNDIEDGVHYEHARDRASEEGYEVISDAGYCKSIVVDEDERLFAIIARGLERS